MPDTFCTQTDQTELAAAERDIPPHKKSELESGAVADTGPAHAQLALIISVFESGILMVFDHLETSALK